MEWFRMQLDRHWFSCQYPFWRIFNPSSDIQEILGDGTFFSVPVLFYQMFTIHLKTYKHESLKFLYTHNSEITVYFLVLPYSLRVDDGEDSLSV